MYSLKLVCSLAKQIINIMKISKLQLQDIHEHASYMAMTASRETLEKMFVQYYIKHSIYLEELNDACK
jgi:hypothetical protein